MSIIPAPLFVENREGQLTLVDQVRIACDGKGTDAIGQYLADHFEDRYELQAGIDIAEPSSAAGDGDILLTRVTEPLESLADTAVPSEAYELEIAENGIVIRALENHGLFNGVQTLIQLLPATALLDALSLQCVKARPLLVFLASVVTYTWSWKRSPDDASVDTLLLADHRLTQVCVARSAAGCWQALLLSALSQEVP